MSYLKFLSIPLTGMGKPRYTKPFQKVIYIFSLFHIQLKLPASIGNLRFAEHLIKNGADTNIRDENEQTPLQLAVRSGHENVVELLITNGADTTVSDRNGKTISDLVAESGKRILSFK